MTEKINTERLTTCIKHLAVSGLSSGTTRIKSSCNLTGQCFDIDNKNIPPTVKLFTSKKVKILNDQLEKQTERIRILEVLNKNLQNVNLDKIEKLKIQELKKTIKYKDKLIESLQNQIADLKIKLYSKKTE